MKLAEAAAFSFVITTVFFWAPYVFPACQFVDEVSDTGAIELLVPYNCPKARNSSEKDMYNGLASLLFNTEGSAIRAILSGSDRDRKSVV